MDRAAAHALAADLVAAGCAADALPGALGAEAVEAMARQVAAPARRAALALGDHPANVLVRCLMLGDAVPTDALEVALPSAGIAGLERLGLAEPDGSRMRSTLAIRPYAARVPSGVVSWWIASDHDELSGRVPLGDDHVLGVGGAGRTLTSLLPATPVDTALDVGSGCGIVSLHLRAIADRVVATDVSARALWCTRLSAALSGVDGIETRKGSLLEPVRGERFDLVASNPPFVITPRAAEVPTLEYRDGGMAGDALMASLVVALPSVLAEHGTAVLLGNWESRDGVEGLERVRTWLGSHAAWVIERESLSPARYAELWVRDGGQQPGSRASDALLEAWLADFDERGVAAIGLGWILLGAERGPQRLERIPNAVDLARVGTHLEAAFEAASVVEGLGDDEVLAMHLVVAPDVTEVRHLRPGAVGPTVIELRQGGGLARVVQAGTGLAALVGASDGELDVATLIDAIAGLVEVDAAELRRELLPDVRELLATGMLVAA